MKVAQTAFDIQFLKQCCSVKHDWMNFNYVSFESILIMLHEINMNIVTHSTICSHCFRVLFFSGTHCKGVSKTTLRLSSLQKRVSGSNAYQIAPWLYFLFRKLDSIPTIKRASKRLFRVVAFIIDLSVSRVRGMPGMLVTAELYCAISSETQCI